MNPEIAEHLDEAQLSLSEALKEGREALFVVLGTYAGSLVVNEFLHTTLPDGDIREAAVRMSTNAGIIFGSAVIVGAAITVGCESGKALYHQIKVSQINRREAKEELRKLYFTWPLSPENSQLNTNL